MSVCDGGYDCFLISYEVGEIEGENGAVDSSVSTGLLSPEQRISCDTLNHVSNFISKAFVQPRFLDSYQSAASVSS